MFGVRTYMNLYLIIFVLSTMVVAINQFDLVTTFTAVASCLNNIGPGLELVGLWSALRIFAADQAGAQL